MRATLLSCSIKKVECVLLLKGIPYKSVEVPNVMPRPDLSERLGVTYRRIPVLAVGNDRRFPSSEGYGTLFPRRKGGCTLDSGLIKVFAMFYTDRVIFPLVKEFLPWAKLPEHFCFQKVIDVHDLTNKLPGIKSALASHLGLLEEQLADGREWWLTRMQGHLASLKKISTSPEKISGEDTAKLIFSSPSEDCDIIGFDEIEAGRLQLARDDVVSVAPSDYGRTPTVGKVLALNREEIVIETRGTGGKVHCHFPRLNFTVAGPKV
ncbi:hypothetical protein OBBRIDRAFT_812406 [Obba rivulosa]|uniref:Uncharacterized protein n=1 Tax=Obba rivulosa TaxID=1052685 RepID=A0A8E2DNQ8_9APHY|nr:hypothetical protein OBBRIDRAFT_812406 [Obba rivulosa]